MFENNLKIAWRNLLKHRLYSTINLTGLTTGMTCFVLIVLFIQFELSYDKHHNKAERIYRVIQQQTGNQFRGTDYYAVSPRPLKTALKADFPEVEAATNIDYLETQLVRDSQAFSQRGLLADSEVFNVFTIPVLEGQGKEALEDPNSILLTKSLALKIFGDNSPLDETVFFNRTRPMTVRGVIPDPPKNQHFSYDFLVSIKLQQGYVQDATRWHSNNYYTYVALAKGTNPALLKEKLLDYDKRAKPMYQAAGFQFYPEYELQPMLDIHLQSNINIELETNGSMEYIYFFALIGLIILGLAAINYINLATVKSAQRAKEVGVSKVLGAKKKQLIIQFLGESFLLTLISFGVALVVAYLALPLFNELLKKDIPFQILGSGWALLSMLSVALLVGGLSGLYPALFLSGIHPVKAFRGGLLKDSQLRNALVVGQFVVAITLGVGSVIIHQQLQFFQTKNLGYNREHVVHVAYEEREISDKEELLRAEFLAHPKIHKASLTTELPLNLDSQGVVDTWEGNPNKNPLYIYRSYVDPYFIDLFEIELVAGRNFSENFEKEAPNTYILNEAAVKKMGWETAVGKEFRDGTVIGVAKDFHIQPFDLAIEPLFMTARSPWQKNHGQVLLKIDTDDFENTKAFIEQKMKSLVPTASYEVQFLEDSYAHLYDSEARLAKAFNIFTLLALFIAGMGLLGLISFQVVKRKKEIGIRKVLGSSVTSIVALLSKDFLKLLLIALIIAIPLAYYAMDTWLQNYAYRIEIAWWVFIFIGFLTFSIAFLTISFQSIQAALTNPIKSLRTE